MLHVFGTECATRDFYRTVDSSNGALIDGIGGYNYNARNARLDGELVKCVGESLDLGVLFMLCVPWQPSFTHLTPYFQTP